MWRFLKILFKQNPCRGGKNQEHTRKETEECTSMENEESTDILNDFFDVDLDGFTEDERKKTNLSERFVNHPKKLEWPLTKEIQQKFIKLARSGFTIFRSDRINT